ncbi:MAG: tRNA (N6-isopentenyl adenosine(37)-C2)-methylthiotransferase MiaB [Rhodospirillales bacterium]|nr:tRNA (N6-isopentenyl adenosine(37)-C2)-methylthiotransferase MiaB [Rhodospirillales bacterium]
MAKTVHIKTYGCQMNVYDSDRMADVLAPLGFRRVDRPDDADLVILNTCHIREKAAEKVYTELGSLKRLKSAREKTGRKMVLAVAGCVAQAEGEEMLARAPFVDIVLGPQTYHRLPRLIADAWRGEGARVETDFPPEAKFDHLPEVTATQGPSAFLTVQEGCDKFCTFCVVPYTRGAEFSRPVESVLAEARRLVALGAREITLLGQNVNNYHGAAPAGGEWRLGRLIGAIAEIEGISRIRYTTSYPADMDDALIAAHGAVPALMPFLHLPAQSGSDAVLRRMNRRHTADGYRRIVDRLRAARPDIRISSDFIVGFPGESDHDIEETLRLVREVGFIQAYSFKYSPRPGTPAATMEDQVPDPVKSERLARLQELLAAEQRAFNASCVGRVMPVLFDRAGRLAGQLIGRSPYMQPVHASVPEAMLGTLADVTITGSSATSLAGAISGLAPPVATMPAQAEAFS